MVKQITLTITRTFTPDDDPFGLFSFMTEAGGLYGAAAEVRYDVLYAEVDRRVAVFNLLEDAVWEAKAE